MEQSPSWEANGFSTNQEIPRILLNPKVHYRIYRSPPPVPILSQINPVLPSHPISWSSTLILSSNLHLGLPSSLFLQVSHQNPGVTYVTHARPSHFSWFDHARRGVYIIKLVFYNLVHSPFISFLLGSNIFLSTLFSNTVSLYSSLRVTGQVSHWNKRRLWKIRSRKA